ncbi:LysR substrate-binding domain-containing protein [Thalassospira xianhensis]|uniref:LysR family transcriptional regulator n=1 Tax=Thalassospira xianhensis MCCC 1A02616 TaxID=1177929 RepID=A0A367U9T9_9PROT|nr:LysR substrate-binding domain-containing protein [Thalassospira xianhensis]RCK05066.1 LysR family transcriptional regulator [Thalassospira xianhensis MCCC 1A02616]
MSSYPPLNSLRAFEASIRLNSFSRAAEELNVTPGAVGQQIRKLEDWLGVELFARSVRQVKPTADGLEYAARISPALQQIIDASQHLRGQREHMVRVVMPPSFAAKWFSKRMARFLIDYPSTSLHVGSSVQFTDFDRDPVDIAVRYFDGNDEKLESVLIYRGQAAAFCSPAYRDRMGFERPADLARATLLNDILHDWWEEWLGQFAEMNPVEIAAIKRIEIDQTSMAIEAAIHGQGVVMANPLLAEEDVMEGKLIHLFPEQVQIVPLGYYLVHPKNRELRGQVKLFRDWLLGEAQELSLLQNT